MIFYSLFYHIQWMSEERGIVEVKRKLILWSLILLRLEYLTSIHYSQSSLKCLHCGRAQSCCTLWVPSDSTFIFCDIEIHKQGGARTHAHTPHKIIFSLWSEPQWNKHGKFHRVLKEKVMSNSTAGGHYATTKITVETGHMTWWGKAYQSSVQYLHLNW